MDLSEFLLARIAEDEAVAREGGRWDGGMEIAWRDVGGISESLIIGTDRVLAECDAKRRIVELAEGPINDLTWIAVGADTTDSGDTDVDQKVLRLLALPYADHPDYRDEWALQMTV